MIAPTANWLGPHIASHHRMIDVAECSHEMSPFVPVVDESP